MSTGRRHPMKLIRFARELYENGRSVDEIRHACAKYGPMPARSTVQTWVSEERRERRLMQQRLRWRTANPNMSEPDRAIDVVSRRMRQLREAGLPYTHISSVLELDFGVRIHHERIR